MVTEIEAGWARMMWSGRRLRAMQTAEIPHRIREQLRRRVDRGGDLARRSTALPRAITDAPPPAWPVDAGALSAALAGGAGGRLQADTEALLEGRFTLLGRTWPAGSRTDWTLDPETGERWPAGVYTYDVDFRHGAARRDIKLAWELGRLQHLQLLAARHKVSGDPRCRRACLSDLAAWIADNPPYTGIGYASGIELACRVVSVMVVAGLLGPGSIPQPLRGDLWRLLSAHGAWLARYPSLYSSANNHRVAELGGLALLGCLAPSLPGAAAWRAQGLEGLAVEAMRQILPDGVGAEQTPTYQGFTMEWLLAARRGAVATGLIPDPRIDARLAAGAEFLAALHDAGGHHPRIGDDDEGVVLRVSLAPERYPASITAAVAASLGRPTLLISDRPPDLRAALLGIAEHPRSTRRPRSRRFPDGGYTLLRASGPRERLLVMDHGPLGLAPLCAHGHADALAIWLHLDGRPVLGEAGTHRYNGAPDWRRWARSTPAHCALSIDGRDSSIQSSGFAWASAATAELIYASEGRAQALHRGYADLGVIHRRSVDLCDSALVVCDQLEGNGVHSVLVSWHFAADLSLAEAPGGGWIVRRGALEVLRLSLETPGLQARLHLGGEAPGPGWVAPAYNQSRPAPTLVLAGSLRLPARLSATFAFS